MPVANGPNIPLGGTGPLPAGLVILDNKTPLTSLVAGAMSFPSTGTLRWVRTLPFDSTQVPVEFRLRLGTRRETFYFAVMSPASAGTVPGARWIGDGGSGLRSTTISCQLTDAAAPVSWPGPDLGVLVDMTGVSHIRFITTATDLLLQTSPDATWATPTTRATYSKAAWPNVTWSQACLVIGSQAATNAAYSTILGIGDVPAAVFDRYEVVGAEQTALPGVLLDPILVRALDQYGTVWTGALPGGATTATVADLALAYDVTGTLTVPFVAGVATFSNLTPVASGAPGGVLLGGTAARAAVAGQATFTTLTLTIV